MIDDAAWARLLAEQDGLVTRAQALSVGWHRSSLAHRVRRGHWQVPVPGVLLTVSGTPTRRQLLRAALLHAGSSAALGAATACAWHGIECIADDTRVHVAVPASVRVRSAPLVRVHATTRPFTPVLVDRLPTVPVARAVVDACLTMHGADDVRALCAEAVQRRMCTVERLSAELARAPSAGSATVRGVLAEIADGARSAPEAALHRSLRRVRRLPAYELNVNVYDRFGSWLARPDVVFWESRVIVEVDGWRWHRDPARQRADMRRQTRLEAAGWTVLRYAAADVLRDPGAVAREVAAIVLARAYA